MDYISVLIRFGLSEREAKIYLDLLEHGDSRVSALASRVGIHRVEVYRLLPGLLTKGIIMKWVVGKTTTYSAAAPEKLESLLEDMRQGFSVILPRLQEKFAQKKRTDSIRVYEWDGALERLYDDIGRELPHGGMYYRYTSRSDEHRLRGKTFSSYRQLRKEKELRRMVIISESGSRTKSSDPNRSIAVVPSRFDAFDDNFQKIIYNDKVVLADLAAGRAYAIENADLARFEIKLFKFMYKFLKEYEK